MFTFPKLPLQNRNFEPFVLSNHFISIWVIPVLSDCGPRTEPVNGSAYFSNGTTYQSLMTFECDTGFEMNGINTAVCLANSTWSHVVPKCIIKGKCKWILV
jgi:hypothetical protein